MRSWLRQLAPEKLGLQGHRTLQLLKLQVSIWGSAVLIVDGSQRALNHSAQLSTLRCCCEVHGKGLGRPRFETAKLSNRNAPSGACDWRPSPAYFVPASGWCQGSPTRAARSPAAQANPTTGELRGPEFVNDLLDHRRRKSRSENGTITASRRDGGFVGDATPVVAGEVA